MSKNKRAKAIKRPKVDNSRKAQRKQKRLQKKVHRQEHYLLKKKSAKEAPKYTPGRFVKRPANDIEPETVVKKKKPNQPSIEEILSKERAKEMKEANKLKSEMDDRRKKMLLQANEDEDKVIKKLEKQLGLNKSKNKNNFFSSDGLDYLLEICDRSTTEQIVAAEKHLAEVEGDSDFDEDLAAVTGKEITKKDKESKKSDEINDDESGDDEELASDIGDSEGSNIDDELGSELGDDEELGSDNEINDDETGDISDDEDNSDLGEEKSDVSEEPEEMPTKSQKSKKSKETQSKNDKAPLKSKDTKEMIVKADELSKVFSDDEISHLSGDDDDDEIDDEDIGDEMNDDTKNEKPDIWEDIYGRKRDKVGNVIKEEKGMYIPPHLRNKDSNSDKELVQLKRQIKSVLNKLTGTNLHWACTSIEQLYNNNSRHSVNCTLTSQWLDAAVLTSLTPDALLTEHVALLAIMHANVYMEIGAHFLQELVKKFDEMTQTQQPLEDKRLDNLVACLALMYSFKMYESPLIMDILTHLLQTPSEKHIDCIITILRQCGATLRKQAATELKSFVQTTQDITVKLEGNTSTGSRIKFLLEVLKAIKNNNLMKIPNYDPSYQEHLKKIIKGIIRKGNYITPLNIRLEDLLKADERGKWWVVGSAWEGQTRPEAQAPVTPMFDNKLMELARKQRMNTDVRRNIFCVIMAAEDYMDAFEKLQHLGLKGQQEREVIHVLLACCLQEKTYNPYYAVLGQKLCDTERKYQLSIQYTIWDKIKDIENQPKQCLNNLAQFVTHLIMEKGLALSVLKVIQFSDLNKHSVRFMRQILLSIIMNENLESALEVFHRISKPPKLHLFRESLKLFIQHFLVKNAGKKSNVLSDSEMVTLKERAAEVHKILTLYETKLQF